jgi:hypothetical protein
MDIPRSSKALAHFRISCASLMLHALWWALHKNMVECREDWRINPEKNFWAVPVKAASELLGSPREKELKLLQEKGLRNIISAADDVKLAESAREWEVFRKTPKPERRAKAPRGYPLPKIAGGDPAVLSRMLLRPLWQATDTGGFSVGRSRFSVLLEHSIDLLGVTDERHSAALGGESTDVTAKVQTIIRANGLQEPMPGPGCLEQDEYFLRLVHETRWMNLMSQCDRG